MHGTYVSITVFIVQVCLDNSDWLGVAKVSELERIPSYGDVIQLTTRVSSPEKCPSYSRFRVIKVRVIETNLYSLTKLNDLAVLSQRCTLPRSNLVSNYYMHQLSFCTSLLQAKCCI